MTERANCQCQIAFFFQSRELEISVNWKDYRNMCAVKFLRLEDFLDAKHDGMIIHLEPQGILFAEVSPIAIHHRHRKIGKIGGARHVARGCWSAPIH